MMDAIKNDIVHLMPNTTYDEASFINIHHNYASLETHFGETLWVHRKGAVLAREGHKGIICGSMGTPTYITEGLGNADSLHTSSHGAGRTKGRKAFNVEMNTEAGIDQIRKSMEGIVYSNFGKSGRGRDEGMLDVSEAPQAYKDIDVVMANQTYLVKPVHKLRAMINWKDTGEE
jgi:tRNA-splicing ligase RtcB